MENSGKMIALLILGVLVFAIICGYYYAIGPLKGVWIDDNMEVYPGAVEVNVSDIVSTPFIVYEMDMSPITLDMLQNLDGVNVYGIDEEGLDVFLWYLALNQRYNWIEDDVWQEE